MPFRAAARRFLPQTPEPEAVAGMLSVVIGVLLMSIKFVAYFITGSAAIFSDALESIVNVLASSFALYALFYAHRPADIKHPYGHGKIEFVSAGFEGGMILVAALVTAIRAVEALIRKPPLEQLLLGVALMALAMIVNGAMGLYLIRAGRKHNSITLQADGKHLFSDAITSAVALIAIAAVKVTGVRQLDPVAALLIAAYLAHMGWGLVRVSSAGLLDEQDIEDQRLLESILDGHIGPTGKEPRICSYHKLRHRHSGRYHWVDFHIMVPQQLNVEQGHAIASAIEYEIEQALGEGNATAHIEPCTNGTCATCPSGSGAASQPPHQAVS
jgi:cation diffusion facilitator family transporter